MAELVKGGGKEQILSTVEQDIVQYIVNNSDECYDDVLAEDGRWEVFYHLSEMRASILNWYDFGKNSTILEVGGGFGAITGMLCHRSKDVTVIEKSMQKAEAISLRYRNRNNLTIYAGDAEKFKSHQQFDYVIITGAACDGIGVTPEKQLERYVRLSREWLKRSGILLLAVDNVNGAKYQCGYPKPVAGSINENGCEAMVSREQLEKIVGVAGFDNQKFYYPFPDYRLAQEIYTDAKLPQMNIKDRVLTYYVLPKMLYKDEYQLYQEKIKEGCIRDICNSYLLECSSEYIYSDINYVSTSTDRGKRHSFATVLGKNKVIKMAIYEEGKEYLRKSCDHILQIKSRGIHVVPFSYVDNKLIMPVMKGMELVRWLFLLAIEDKEGFILAIDKLYESILKSSEFEEKAGEIYLKNGYIDMIPLNCFVEDGEFYFFDQEFCEKDCPINYIMFRALRYTYLTYPELYRYVELEEMKRRYGLEDKWKKYLLKEDVFIWKIRQHRINNCFYKWVENRVLNRPIIFIEGECALYLAKGFDEPENDGQNIWIWAIEKDAHIFLKNCQNKKIKVEVKLTLYPPPGKMEQKIIVAGTSTPENEVNAPVVFTWSEEIEVNEVRRLGFHIMDELVGCNNGDRRSFAFQLVNPQMILI